MPENEGNPPPQNQSEPTPNSADSIERRGGEALTGSGEFRKGVEVVVTQTVSENFDPPSALLRPDPTPPPPPADTTQNQTDQS